MALKVEVILKEIIKPSTPTPLHLRTMKFSLIDQYMGAAPVYIINFYPANNNAGADHLKKSLSQVLTDFYPLAGRVRGNHSIDCNDEGINLVETQVTGSRLSDVISNPEADQLTQLLPVDNFYSVGQDLLLSIQLSHFDCGGLAIAVSMSHKVGDASSLSLFLNHWAAVCRGERKDNFGLKFDTSSLFPPPEQTLPAPQATLPMQKLVSKRFVFDACNITALRAKITDNLDIPVPTRVEAISALMWRCAMNGVKMRTGAIQSQSAAAIPVNLRGRLVPPVSNYWFGNISLAPLVKTNTENHDQDLHFFVIQVREAIKRIDGNYATDLQTLDGHMAYLNHMIEVFGQYGRGELEFFCFTSWCKFPFHAADFGWGSPIWVTIPQFSLKNLVTLIDTKCGQGVEAWVTLEEEDMVRFQCEPDLIAFTSTTSEIS